MSIQVMSRVWTGFQGGGSELLALLAMADWSDDNGRCYPSIAAIGRKTRLSEKQARRIVHRLIEDGVVKVVAGKDGGKGSRRYQIVLDRLLDEVTNSPLPPVGGLSRKGGLPHVGGPLSLPGEATPPADGSRTVIDTSLNHQSMADKPLVSSKAADLCPHQAIIDLYHQTLPTGRQVRIWSDARKAKLRARWKEDPKRQSLEWWGKFFRYVAESDFLTGKTASTGRQPFELDLEWIVSPANFVKIIEGKYHREAAA